MAPPTTAAARELVRALVRIPSVNPALAPGADATGEARLAAWIHRWLDERDIRAWVDEVAPGRPNVVAELGRGATTLVFCGHLDTVGVADMEGEPFDGRVDGARVYGRGAYDMKGGLAAILLAAEELRAAPPPGVTLRLALVVDEEYGSLGAEDYVRRYGPGDACVLTEPSDERLVLGHKGFAWVELVTEGVAAHGSRWDRGVSAIGKMARIVAALERFDAEVLRRRVHSLVGPASLHVSHIEGGSGLSTYAARCRAVVERRLLPGESVEAAVAEIVAVVRDAGETARVRTLFDRKPMLCDASAPLARALRAATTEILGRPAETTGVGYWMDAALFAEAGAAAANLGPAGAGEHAAVEWVDADSVARCARILAQTARRWLAQRGS